MATPSAELLALKKARQAFILALGEALDEASLAGEECLIALADTFATAKQSQERQEAFLEYRRLRPDWIKTTHQRWSRQAQANAVTKQAPSNELHLEIEGDNVMEHKIRASRLAMFFQQVTGTEFGDLRLRILHVEQRAELSEAEVFQPTVFALSWIEAWHECGLSDATWDLCGKAIQEAFQPVLQQAYAAANTSLVAAGILPKIDFRAMIRRSTAESEPAPVPQVLANTVAPTPHQPTPSSQPLTLAQQAAQIRQAASQTAGQELQQAYPGGVLPTGTPGSAHWTGGGSVGGTPHQPSHFAPSVNQWLMDQSGHPLAQPGQPTAIAHGSGVGVSGGFAGGGGPAAGIQGKAQQLIGQLGHLLRDKAGFVPATPAQAQATALAADAGPTVMRTVMGIAAEPGVEIPADATPAQAVALLKEHSASLKRKAATQQEKATIEIVALMFQSILAEERIGERIRLLIARLQMPVIRVALAEPAFFDALDHPARKLIDRLGACVLGLDTANVSSKALEAEIMRVVQMVEQYAETGQRIFKLVLGEFETFLKNHLSDSGSNRKVAGVAQQIEQRETLAIQYTIEIRNLIQDFAISDIVREFLLKTWSEVLAVCAVRFGKDHETTLRNKEVTTRLVWAAGAKPNRSDRARMIAEMPGLLQQLRAGMEMISLPAEVLEGRIKILGDALTEAFKNKTDAIPAEKLCEMSDRLQNLEEFFTDDNLGDLPIDAETIELMLDLDAQALSIVTDQPVEPSEASKHWARELALGQWFNFTQQGQTQQVQYAWHSDMKQLHLFANLAGKSILIAAGALAAHLQNGQMAAMEEEALSVRATRDALTKLHANPEQLLG